MRVGVTALSLSLVVAPAADARPVDATVALAAQAEAFMRVRSAFDQAAMIAMMAPDYQEVSPLGDVDSRERVIGFYAADKKAPAPPMTMTETVARASGGVGQVTMRITYAIPDKDGQVKTHTLRAGFVARRTGGVWRFAFVQFTPIRS